MINNENILKYYEDMIKEHLTADIKYDEETYKYKKNNKKKIIKVI